MSVQGVSTDWQRYAGSWYEQARIPSRFESKDSANVTALYTPIPNKKNELQVENRSINLKTKKEAVAKGNAQIDMRRPGTLRVKFFWLQPRADYIVLARDAGYTWSLVGSKNRDLLWLLTRDRNPVGEDFINQMKGIAKEFNYTDKVLDKFEPTPMF